MKILEFAFFAYPVTDIERSRKFYEEVLEFTPSKPPAADAQWVEYQVGPHTLGIGKSDQWKPSMDGASLALEVEDFAAAVGQLQKHGVEFHMGPLETPVCHMAVFRDPDGNKLVLHKRKPGNS